MKKTWKWALVSPRGTKRKEMNTDQLWQQWPTPGLWKRYCLFLFRIFALILMLMLGSATTSMVYCHDVDLGLPPPPVPFPNGSGGN